MILPYGTIYTNLCKTMEIADVYMKGGETDENARGMS